MTLELAARYQIVKRTSLARLAGQCCFRSLRESDVTGAPPRSQALFFISLSLISIGAAYFSERSAVASSLFFGLLLAPEAEPDSTKLARESQLALLACGGPPPLV